jgi:hypothetical protein
MNPADVVIHLNAIVQLGRGIAEENLVWPVKPQRTVRLLLAKEGRIFCNPFVDNSRFPQGVRSRDGNAHGGDLFARVCILKTDWKRISCIRQRLCAIGGVFQAARGRLAVSYLNLARNMQDSPFALTISILTSGPPVFPVGFFQTTL